MRLSKTCFHTLKEAPKEEIARNAQLLIRAGYITKVLSGVYAFLPLGLRMIEKISQVVREEMQKVEAEEILMPALAPREHWEKTNRWESLDVLFRLNFAENKWAALSPTHEETVTPLVQHFCRSYKQLPFCVFQIQWKFRAEPRAKSGLLRGREFLMKDAYSFHTSKEDLDAYYERQKEAYMQVYKRLGLGEITKIVEASGGSFSRFSHEFQVLHEIGEDWIFALPEENIYINREIAPSFAPLPEALKKEPLKPLEVVKTDIVGAEALAEFFNIPLEKTTKTLFFETDKGFIAAVVRGTHEINEEKLQQVLNASWISLASEEQVKARTGASIGYAGVLNLDPSIPVIWDDSLKGLRNFEMGNNREGEHCINVNFERDIPLPETFYDIKLAKPGDWHPTHQKPYEVFKGVEVGNIFKLGTKYSDPFDFTVLDEEGKEVPVVMGCYGIGITRLLGVLAEVFQDERGLKWPKRLAPYHLYLCPIGKDERVYREAEKWYEILKKEGFEVILDDRKGKKFSPGQKFADHELLGIPVRIVFSEKHLKGERPQYEVFLRTEGKIKMQDEQTLVPFLKEYFA